MAVEGLGEAPRVRPRLSLGWLLDRVLRRAPSRTRAGDPLRALRSPAIYARQIDRLHERHLLGPGMHQLREGDVSLASVVARRDEVARVLAGAVAAGEYRFRAATVRSIRAGGKRRDVVSLGLADTIVGAAVAAALDEALAATLSPSLYSYRPGVPWWRGAQAFGAFARAHAAARPDPRTRGLYVLRRDVEAYTDTIPVEPGSEIWPQLRGILGEVRPVDWRLIEDALRPEMRRSRSGPAGRRAAGVPTGQPISCTAFNLYLTTLDHELAKIPGAFYARYSDDLLFAHADPRVAVDAAARIEARVGALGLRLNPEKSQDLYLNGAGRPSEVAVGPTFRGTTAVPFLGLRIGAAGTLALAPLKARRFTRDLARRAAGAARVSTGPDEAARRACAAIRRALFVDDPATRAAAAVLLRAVVTDRGQLAELDRRIAQAVATVVTGEPSGRAFRHFPIHRLREEFGLPSLVELRNAHGAPGRRRGRRR